jgi:carboxyl-terminal processing protease
MDTFQINNQNKKQYTIPNVFYVVFFGLLIFFGGFYFGYAKQPASSKVSQVLNQDKPKGPDDQADFEEFWKVWNLINEKYPDAKKVSNQDRIYGAIAGLVASTKDPYTVFFPPEESKSFNDEVTGSFSGIGVEIGIKDGLLVVIAPLKGSPAESAGIKAGDYFLKIDDLTVADMTLDESIRHIRGEKGTKVKLTIVRKEETKPIDISVTRDIINIPTIDEMELGDTYLISLYNFNASSAELMHKAFKNAQSKNKKNVIVDLRGNPGGYLESAIDISSDILKEGTLIVTEDYGSEKKPVVHRSAGNGLVKNDIKIVVLLDKGSASASEIVAGALQDNKRATIIGETSFGKGSVQELLPVSKDTSIKITIANWLTPNGSTISKKGITPDIIIKQDSSKKGIEDPTIIRALEFFKTGK